MVLEIVLRINGEIVLQSIDRVFRLFVCLGPLGTLDDHERYTLSYLQREIALNLLCSALHCPRMMTGPSKRCWYACSDLTTGKVEKGK